MKRTLIIDNYDSFTHILRQYVGQLGGNPEVHFNDKISVAQIRRIKPTHIILSPGPGTVDEMGDVGAMFEVIEAFHKKIPILGVCLGHQALGKFFGGKIVRAPRVMHGKRSKIHHLGEGIFRGIKSPMEAMRYHSLIVETPFWMESADVEVDAHTDDFLIMGLRHKKYPVFGIQFHPESFGTPDGMRMMRNFLNSK